MPKIVAMGRRPFVGCFAAVGAAPFRCDTPQAFDEAASRLLAGEKPALVLMDLALPDMDGLEVVRALKLHRELQDVPVIAVTAYTQRADEERARTGGCAGFLAKPVKLGELLRMARSLLGLDP